MLNITKMGSGPDLVLLHGWGLNQAIWQGVSEQLASHHTLHFVDLPGYGTNNEWAGLQDLNTITQAVINSVPEGAVWLGWSLGGMVALNAAAEGANISKLIITASSPKFCQGGNWHAGIEPHVLEQFADDLKENHKLTLLRFLALQARGSDKARDEIRILRESVFVHGEPSAKTLAAGLDILQYDDLRLTAPHINQPTLVIYGLRDTLIPVEAIDWFAQNLSHCTIKEIIGAGHAPFLSHPEQFIAAVDRFCDA
ncbi:MAG: pimeloyl-ACP methyl ester esterase BioH [Gammaproteobacteria bacterium]|nr:pimeloyl-ACP methyl ester esterase BioH [Gammaproteobacteria bacterium]